MTNPAYEATNSDMEKLIKYARINAECGEHASPEEILKLVAALENERKQKNSWKNLAKKSISERSVDIEALLSARQRIAELKEQKDKWSAWAIALGAKADELESRPLCVKSNDAMREAAPLCVKLPMPYDINVAGERVDWEKGDHFDRDEVIEAIRAGGGTIEGD